MITLNTFLSLYKFDYYIKQTKIKTPKNNLKITIPIKPMYNLKNKRFSCSKLHTFPQLNKYLH